MRICKTVTCTDYQHKAAADWLCRLSAHAREVRTRMHDTVPHSGKRAIVRAWETSITISKTARPATVLLKTMILVFTRSTCRRTGAYPRHTGASRRAEPCHAARIRPPVLKPGSWHAQETIQAHISIRSPCEIENSVLRSTGRHTDRDPAGGFAGPGP